MGGAAASETLIGGYIWTIGGVQHPPKNILEGTLRGVAFPEKALQHSGSNSSPVLQR